MRLIAAGLFASLAGFLAVAADKDADQAKELAIAFVKAVKAKDIDAVMKTVDVPFLVVVNRKPTIIEKLDDLRSDLKSKLDMAQNLDKLPNEVGDFLDLPGIRKKLETNPDKDVIKLVEAVLGEKGYAVGVGKSGERGVAVFVRIKDGKAAIVGLPR
jgi:hypothetical protein